MPSDHPKHGTATAHNDQMLHISIVPAIYNIIDKVGCYEIAQAPFTGSICTKTDHNSNIKPTCTL